MENWNNKVIVITGGTAGVGRAIAEEFAKKKAKVAVIARGEKKLISTVRELQNMGAVAFGYVADVAFSDQVEAAAEEIEAALGPIDVWVNNAMVTVMAPVKETSAEEIKRTTEVVYLGSVNGTLTALKRFLPRNEGHIIQIGSALAYQSIPLQAAYCGAKHAIHGFLESFGIELKHDKSKVKLSELQLPAVNTPQFEWGENKMQKHAMPVPPIYEPEVIARAVSYLVEHPRREMWLGFSAVKAIVASKFAPRIAEWYLSKKGYSSQQTNKESKTNENDLWRPVPRDYGAHGIFDRTAKDKSLQFELNSRREILALSGLALSGTYFLWRKYSKNELREQ